MAAGFSAVDPRQPDEGFIDDASYVVQTGKNNQIGRARFLRLDDRTELQESNTERRIEMFRAEKAREARGSVSCADR